MPDTGAATRPSVAAWDLPTRLFHWTLVTLIVLAWLTYEQAEAMGDPTLVLHRTIGLVILTLVMWRILWGVLGSSTSRFANFLGSPAAALTYGRDLFAGTRRHFLGHNPLGALMVLALLTTVLAVAVLGLFATDDNDLVGGPLYRLVSEETNDWATHWHEELFEALLLPLVAIHVAANALYGILRKEPLIPAMVTGRKPAADYEDEQEAKLVPRPLLRALLCLMAATALVVGALLGLGGRLL